MYTGIVSPQNSMFLSAGEPRSANVFSASLRTETALPFTVTVVSAMASPLSDALESVVFSFSVEVVYSVSPDSPVSSGADSESCSSLSASEALDDGALHPISERIVDVTKRTDIIVFFS